MPKVDFDMTVAGAHLGLLKEFFVNEVCFLEVLGFDEREVLNLDGVYHR